MHWYQWLKSRRIARSVGKGVGELGLPCTVGEGPRWGPFWRTVSYKLKMELTYDSTIPFLSAFPKEKKTCMFTQRPGANARLCLWYQVSRKSLHFLLSPSWMLSFCVFCFMQARPALWSWAVAQALFLLFILKQGLTNLPRPSLNSLCTPDSPWAMILHLQPSY